MYALQIGAIAYGIAALAFLVLVLLIKPSSWALSSPATRLWIAALISVAWAALASAHGFLDCFTNAALYGMDITRLAAWLWALLAIAELQGLSRSWRVLIQLVLLTALPAAAVLLLLSRGIAQAGAADYGLSVLALVISLLGIFSVEQIYRNASVPTRPALRWLTTGLGGLFVVDLFVLAEAVLTRGFAAETWAARGLLAAFLSVPIALGARRLDQRWTQRLFLSRQVVFYTTSFMLVGAYLILMSLGGFYLRSSGATWGRPAQIFFLTAATLLLGFLIFSGTIRRRFMVWLSKSFYTNRYDYRSEWLRFIRTLSSQTPTQSIQQTAIVSVAQIIGSEQGALWVRGEGTEFLPITAWPEHELHSAMPVLPGSDALVSFMVRTGWVVDLQELSERPALYDDLRVDDTLSRSYHDGIILPLLHHEQMYGFLALARPRGLGSLNFEDRDLLKTVGRHLAAHLSQDDNDRRLAESRQFETYNRLTAFVMHDLKNLTAQLQLVVHNAERHKRKPEFVDDAIATIANSVDRMSRLLAQLTQGHAAEQRRVVDLAELVARVIHRAGNRAPVPTLKVVEPCSTEADPDRLMMVLEHVVRNAQDASAESGSVTIELDCAGDAPRIRVSDHGEGMDETFMRERLFRPFDTTKGSKGMGIGAYQAREYLRSLGGEVAVSSTVGQGTVFSFLFSPRAAAARIASR